MPEKDKTKWIAAVRRWLVVGGLAGFVFGTFAHFAWEGPPGLLGSLTFFVPMGAGVLLVLWAGMYRYEFAKVWGWWALAATAGLVALLIGTSIGAGCLQGICGSR